MAPAASLADLTASCFDLRWHVDPVAATAAGLHAHDGRLGSYGPDDIRAHVAAFTALTGALEELEVEALDDEIDRTALLYDARVAIHRFTKERPHEKDPGFWLNHAFEGLYQLLVLRDRPAEQRSRAVASRLAALPAFFSTAEDTLKDCPAVLVETALEVARAGRTLVGECAAELRPLEPDDQLFVAAVAAANEALEGFERFLDKTRDGPGGDFAVGERALEFRLKFEHAVAQSPDELWRYGWKLAEEVEAELETLGKAVDASVPWPDLVDRLRGEHPAAGGVVAAYADAMERARAFVEERRLVTLPEGALNVVATPSYLRPLIPFAAYQPPGPFSADRTGLFYVTPPPTGNADARQVERLLRDHCTHELAGTALHEGYPGHHLQFLHAFQQPRPVRQVLGTPLTIEGWALYCEDMMGEEGFYHSAEERFFQKVHLLWRALRVVLDVGLHTRGMSVDEAVGLLVDRVHFDRSSAEAEVRRYCATPGYQLCYAVGRREIKSLRDAYRAAHGASASLAGFHAAVLRFGGLPVSLTRWGLGLSDG